MRYILAHDLGTTGNKANLFDEAGRLVASHTSSYPVDYAQPGWAEQDPNDWWRAVCESTRALLASVPGSAEGVAAVSFSGQMMGAAAVDAAGDALGPCIIWADMRAVEESEFIAQQCGMDAVYRRTGHRVSPAYTAAKILWIKRHDPERYARTRHFLFAKDFCVLKLTGVAVTDCSDASGSNLYDLIERCWRTDFCGQIGIDPAKLPRIVNSNTVVGAVTSSAAAQSGLKLGTPVVIGGGDGACATVGAGSIEPGDCYAILGTSAWVAMTSAAPILDPAMRTFTFAHLHPDRFMPTGTMQSACGSRDWLVRQIGEVPDEAIAAVPSGSHGLLFLPYLIGERSPWWNPKARGAFVGLTMVHGKPEMARAALEGVAYNLKLVIDAFEESGAHIPSVRLIGGGARSAPWQQILANVFGKPIHLPELTSEATSWGAAVAGGVAVGLYPDWSIAASQAKVASVVEPEPTQVTRYAENLQRFQTVYRALEPVFSEL